MKTSLILKCKWNLLKSTNININYRSRADTISDQDGFLSKLGFLYNCQLFDSLISPLPELTIDLQVHSLEPL